MTDFSIRPATQDDRDSIAEILRRTEEFKAEEVDCACELLDEAVRNGNNESEYAFYCAENGRGGIAGFICYGETALAKSVYDLYWIVTDPVRRRAGVARLLMRRLDELLEDRGARMLVAETSSLPSYKKARALYEETGFGEESRIRDFYAPGDDRITYCKRYR